MTELQLYKFIENNGLEYHWVNPNNDGIFTDVILFIPIYLLKDWNDLLGRSIKDDDGINCVMKDGYFCFYMLDICDYFDIYMDNVFEKNE